MSSGNQPSILAAFEVLACALGEAKCIYLSTPMTNGPRLIDFYKKSHTIQNNSGEYSNLFKTTVLIPNCEEGRKAASTIRKKSEDIVLDPSCFDIKGWSQEEYLQLWCMVIKRYAKEVYFNTGWHYSNGCITEFLTAKDVGIPTFKINGEYIRLSRATCMISQSLQELTEAGIDTTKIKATLEQLKQYEFIDV